MRELSIAEVELLEQLAEIRLLSSEIDAEAVRALERDGLVRRMPNGWRVTPAGALALMLPAR
jgi:DNA-binding GntR family transcriptional regulator